MLHISVKLNNLNNTFSNEQKGGEAGNNLEGWQINLEHLIVKSPKPKSRSYRTTQVR